MAKVFNAEDISVGGYNINKQIRFRYKNSPLTPKTFLALILQVVKILG